MLSSRNTDAPQIEALTSRVKDLEKKLSEQSTEPEQAVQETLTDNVSESEPYQVCSRTNVPSGLVPRDGFSEIGHPSSSSQHLLPTPALIPMPTSGPSALPRLPALRPESTNQPRPGSSAGLHSAVVENALHFDFTTPPDLFPTNSASVNLVRHADVMQAPDSAHGTLLIGRGGRSKYLGPTAASEWLKDVCVIRSYRADSSARKADW